MYNYSRNNLLSNSENRLNVFKCSSIIHLTILVQKKMVFIKLWYTALFSGTEQTGHISQIKTANSLLNKCICQADIEDCLNICSIYLTHNDQQMTEFPSLLWRICHSVFRCCDPRLDWRRFEGSTPPAATAERHTAPTASAWLEPQRLWARSLRLPPPGTFPGFQGFQIQRSQQREEACVPPELCTVPHSSGSVKFMKLGKENIPTCPPVSGKSFF